MRQTLFVFGLFTLSFSALAQYENVETKLEELITKWDLEAESLSSYEGLTQFCMDKNYITEIIRTLKDIHHYDSVLYQKIAEKEKVEGSREMKKTLEDIIKFENGYTIKDFLIFLKEECVARSTIEKNAKQTGEDKDGEAYVLETELVRYVKHITKRVHVIRRHIHHLQIK